MPVQPSPSFIASFNITVQAIPVTEAQLLALIAANALKPQRTYKVTDLADGGAYFVAMDTNTIDPNGAGIYYVPNYATHAQYANGDGAVANGATVTWGGRYWTNATGAGAVPAMTSQYVLDPTFTPLAKSVANGYTEIALGVLYSVAQQEITEAWDDNGNRMGCNALARATLGYDPIQVMQWGVANIFNNTVLVCNNKLSGAGVNTIFGNSGGVQVAAANSVNMVAENILTATTTNTISNCRLTGSTQVYRNAISNGYIVGVLTTGTGNSISSNVLSNSAGISTITMGSSCTINSNTISTTSGSITTITMGSLCTINSNSITGATDGTTIPSIGYIEMLDASTINSNTLSGNGSAIFDLVLKEECAVNSNTLSAVNCRISNLRMQFTDTCSGNTLDNDNNAIRNITMLGNCRLDNSNFIAAQTINQLQLVDAELTGIVTSLEQCNFEGFDLNAPANPITGLDIINGNGAYSITHDFGTSPLAVGNSVDYGFLPIGSGATRLVAMSNGALAGGVTPRLSVSYGAANISIAATTVATYNGAMQTGTNVPATGLAANDVLRITAINADTNAGKLTIYVNFVVRT